MAGLARQWTQQVFGRLSREIPRLVWAEPGQPGNLFDAFAYQEWSFEAMNDVLRRDEARWWLVNQLSHAGPASVVLREHHAYPSFDEHSHPQNEEARIIDQVIGDLVADQEVVTRILRIHRGWYGLAIKEEQKILLRMFRERTVRDNQWNLGDMFQTIIHEIQHHVEAPEYTEFVSTLLGEHARNAAEEGVPSGMTELVYGHGQELMSGDAPYLGHVRGVVEGEYASEAPLPEGEMPDPAVTQRYRSHAEAEDLIRLAGFLNVLAAFLAGDITKITGPDRGSPRSLLAPVGTARRAISDLTTPSLIGSPPPPPAPPLPPLQPLSIATRRQRPVSGSYTSATSGGSIATRRLRPVSGSYTPARPGSPLGLERGWEWLDEDRGIAIPADPALTGGVPTDRADWRATQPRVGRRYAVHLPTGMIAEPGQAADGPPHVVHEISYGWRTDGPDLVHETTGAVLRGQDATIGLADRGRVQQVAERARSAQPEVRDQARQLNRDDLLTWLLEHGALAGPVPGLVTGRGWQPLTVSGGTRWVWNSPGVPTRNLPPGLDRGTATGVGMRCLLDSLRQLTQQLLPGEQRDDMTIEFLVNWLDEHLPDGNEARAQLQTEDAVDVRSVLPTFTSMFQVRVQVFEHDETVLASDLEGPDVDQDGNPTPVLRLYWRSGHFVPVFESAGPVARLPVRRPLGGGPPAAEDGQGPGRGAGR